MTDTKISAENLFSLPICVIMGLTKSLPCVKGGAELMRGGGIVKAKGNEKQSLSRLRRQLPLHKGAFGCTRSSLGVWALPDAFVKQMRNWR